MGDEESCYTFDFLEKMSKKCLAINRKLLFQYPGVSACGYTGLDESGWSGRGPWGAPGPPLGAPGAQKGGFRVFGVCVCVCVCDPVYIIPDPPL